VEVMPPSNSRGEIEEKVQLYLTSGAHEVWVVFEDERIEYHTCQGRRRNSAEAPSASERRIMPAVNSFCFFKEHHDHLLPEQPYC
jgi:Uma2 family endonuclease